MRTWARSASAARLSVTATPRRPHPAVSPASAPTAGCPFRSTAPTSTRFGVSLIRLTSRVPMRPPAPVTITLTTSLPYRFFQNSIERVAPHGTLAERSEEHTSELQSLAYLVCRLLLEKKKQQ